ncbi:MAG: hypothetical protein H6553_09945 [Chitinophagales bacterium]|nr:hypothetical protein [Chitinophagales bacterium]
MEIIKSYLKNLEGLDSRSLSLFRILFGLFLLINFIQFKVIPINDFYMPVGGIFDLEYFHSDKTEYVWSILSFFNTNFLFIGFTILTILFILLFIAGFYIRLVSIILFILLWSWNQRFYMLEMGWERYGLMLLFCSIFLKLDCHFTFRKSNISVKNAFNFLDFGVLVLLVQVGFIYFFTSISKNGDLWLYGEAVKYLASDFVLVTKNAQFILDYFYLSKFLTYLTLIIEFSIIFLIFIPSKYNKYVRILVPIFILGLHFSIHLVAHIGNFYLIAIALFFLFIPSFIWDMILKSNAEYVKFNYNKKYMYYIYFLVSFLFITNAFNRNVLRIIEKDTVLANNLKKLKLDKILSKVTIPKFDVSPIFNQGWSYYSPNPNVISGVYTVELIKDSTYYQIYPKEQLQLIPFKNVYKNKLELYFLLKSSYINTKGYKNLRAYWAKKRYKQYYNYKNYYDVIYLKYNYCNLSTVKDLYNIKIESKIESKINLNE